MRRFASMRGTGQGKFLLAEAVSVGSAAFDQRQGLDRLDRRAREHRTVRVADLKKRFAGGVHYGDRATMLAFDDVSAQDFHENGIGHEFHYLVLSSFAR